MIAESADGETDPLSTHELVTDREGGSEVEQLADKIETRRANRCPISMAAKIAFLTSCRDIATTKEYPIKSKIMFEDLLQLRHQVQQKVKNESMIFGQLFDIKSTNMYMLQALERAIQHVDEIDDTEDAWFSYQDFSFYHTKVESPFPWMRNASMNAFMVVLLFYIGTPIFFCHVVGDKDICDTSSGTPSWVSAIYFASTTLSTVGYGDMTVAKNSSWSVLWGALYMIISVSVSITAFGAAASDAFSPFSRFYDRFVRVPPTSGDHGEFLHNRIRRVAIFKLSEIVFHFVVFNAVGVIVSRFFTKNVNKMGEPWSWVEATYWAIQTTTTIGYGDMSMSSEMRLFQAFYLSFFTFLVGNTLGKLAEMKLEMNSLAQQYAWERRRVSKEMIVMDQAYDHDDKIDQYEFVVASLLNLGKISSEDIKPIMSKFRKLAKESGTPGFIDLGREESESSEAGDPYNAYQTFY